MWAWGCTGALPCICADLLKGAFSGLAPGAVRGIRRSRHDAGSHAGRRQFSGQVLRKPSVTVYGSVAAALLFVYLHPTRGTARALETKGMFVERRKKESGKWGNRQGGTV